MNTQKLTIGPMTIMGRHGVTEHERTHEQRFVVTVSFSQHTSLGIQNDRLDDVVDYIPVKKLVETIIHGPSVCLLEKLTHMIAHTIAREFPVWDIEVSITKPDIIEIGVPKATTHVDYGEYQGILDFDIHTLVRELALCGGTSIPILTDSFRKELLDTFRELPFKKMPEEVSGGKVREDIWSSDSIGEHPRAIAFRDVFTRVVKYKLLKAGLSHVFHHPLHFTELSLQYYKEGSYGITPHKDGKSIQNIICVFILEGSADFALCDDRAGNNPRYLNTSPGNMLVLAAPGFLHDSIQPFHFVKNIMSDRYVFGLRQKISS